MPDTKYAVLFQGELVEGSDHAQVKEAFARLFKLDQERLEKLFAQKRAILKRGLTEQEASRYVTKLRAIGVIVELLPLSPPAQPAAAEPPVAGEKMPLPEIGLVADDDVEVKPKSAMQEWGPYASMGWGEENRPRSTISASDLALEPESEIKKRVPSGAGEPRADGFSASGISGAGSLGMALAGPGDAAFGTIPPSGGGGPAQAPEDAEPEERIRELSFEFTGNGGEFFRIWIVNVLLTIVTLGVYSAWAKVRTMRYFYGNTHLDGSSFEYLADPVRILKGRAIAFALLAVYVASGWISVPLSIASGLLLAVATPWIIARALSFRNHNSAWRGVRFGFDGTVGGAFVSFLLWPMLPGVVIVAVFLFGSLALFSGTSRFPLGLILSLLLIVLVVVLAVPPRMFRSQTYYVVNNSRYGKTYFENTAELRNFFSFYFAMVAISAVGGAVVSLVGKFPALELACTFLLYFALFVYYKVTMTNLKFGHSLVGSHAILANYELRSYGLLALTNILGIILTLGLFYPFARVRTARYAADHIGVMVNGSLDGFIADQRGAASAVGGEIGELFAIDIGF